MSNEHKIHIEFPGRILFIGFGSIGQGVLPLVLRHIGIKARGQPHQHGRGKAPEQQRNAEEQQAPRHSLEHRRRNFRFLWFAFWRLIQVSSRLPVQGIRHGRSADITAFPTPVHAST